MSIDIQELTSRKTQESFPNILVSTPNETLPVVVRTLEKGDMQLIVEFNGQRKIVDRISQSAYNIDKLLRTVGKISFSKSADERFEIETVLSYLSCV